MNSTVNYIKEWQQALQLEILHLKKYGSTKYLVSNGHLLTSDGSFNYYFETGSSVKIPVGSLVRLEWGGIKQDGRILSSEGKSIIIVFDRSLGDIISEAFLYHDPWELLEQLIIRLDEIKRSKRKRLRIKRLMDPSMPQKHPLTEKQSSVKELYSRSKFNPVTFVWGPPGTGKTYTLARTVANHYLQAKKVLVLSHSNQAVDVLMAEISSFIKKKDRFKEGDVLRYGSQIGESLAIHDDIVTGQLLGKHEPTLIKEKEELGEEKRLLKYDLAGSFSKRDTDQLIEIEKKLAKVLEKIRQKEIQFVKEAKVIGTTLAKAANDETVYQKEYDLVILDEASMAYVPQVAFAAALAKHIIVCGDFKQLPPIASARDSLVKLWLKEDIFHRAGVAQSVEEGELHPHLFLLKEQRRMHPDISAFTNRVVYNNFVGDHKSVATSREGIMLAEPFANRASALLDTSLAGEYCITERTSHSRMNLWQLLLSFQLIHEAYVGGSRSIGYVAPYRAQAELMEKLLDDLYEKERQTADIIAATVHRFQGSEREMMIFDTVDSYPQNRAGMLLTGRESERLINVAITRTKGKFVHVCDTSFVNKHVYRSKTLRQLVDHQIQNDQIVSKKDIGKWVNHQHPKLRWMHARKLGDFQGDIETTKHDMVIAVPDLNSLSEEWQQYLMKRNPAVKLTIISAKRNPDINSDHFICSPISFAFIIFDHRVIWLGLPVESNNRVQPPYIAARLDSKIMADELLSQFKKSE
ncbi:AAA domain-containing protein [Peribacillus frigoritolerans]|uniref:AAA domain-containing protein n=1 Tax=Peribacillus frigoritolerans TaxID=450367 RepID=UPI000D03847A|nr:AAA domain-containing protein [Peribacillus frigoritolerans]MDG4849426.1 AAA domain-containing protein [Peribacillus frigoritolerans]PRS29529.1 DNA helicase [Bacillus sp. RJGP41]